MPETIPGRILHVISTLDTGGAEQNLGRLVSRMDRTAFQNMVVSMTTIGPIGENIQHQGVPVARLGMRKGFPDPVGLLRLKKIIRDFKPDIIQTWMYHANLLGIAVSSRPKLVWNIRCSDMDLSRYGLVYRLSVRAGALCARIPNAIITNSFTGKAVHEHIGYSSRHWEIIPNGFDCEAFHPDADARSEIRMELNIPSDALVIGLIARLDPMKDHQTFFAAARILQDRHPNVHFVLAGRGVELSNPAIQASVGGLLKQENLHLLGERHDINRILTALDITTCSSAYGEGTPTIIGEALSTGIPCVVTDVGDARRMVGDTGIIVPPKDLQALAQAWSGLIQAGPGHRVDLGRKARERIQKQYSMAAMVQRYENLYRDIKKDYEADLRGSLCRR